MYLVHFKTYHQLLTSDPGPTSHQYKNCLYVGACIVHKLFRRNFNFPMVAKIALKSLAYYKDLFEYMDREESNTGEAVLFYIIYFDTN